MNLDASIRNAALNLGGGGALDSLGPYMLFTHTPGSQLSSSKLQPGCGLSLWQDSRAVVETQAPEFLGAVTLSFDHAI